MNEATYALVGIVAGALLTGGIQYLLERRRDRIAARAAARLVRQEFDAAVATIQAVMRRSQGDRVPLARLESPDEMWLENRGRLAAVLRRAEWMSVDNAVRFRRTLRRTLEDRADDARIVTIDEELASYVAKLVPTLNAGSKALWRLGGSPIPLVVRVLTRVPGGGLLLQRRNRKRTAEIRAGVR